MADTEASERNVGSGAVLVSLAIYVGIFVVIIIIFTLIHYKCVKLYNPRECIPQLRSPLSSWYHNRFTWIKEAFTISDDDIYNYSGLDAVAFIRLLKLGYKVAIVGVLNSIYLIPTYKFSDNTTSTNNDELEMWSLGHLIPNSPGLWAAFIASYIIFMFTMYLIYHEFRWYCTKRHDYLSRIRVDNYSIYVCGIPTEMQSNQQLRRFFNNVMPNTVADVSIALEIDEIEKAVGKRASVVSKLEHAYNVLKYKGVRPKHKVKICGKEKVDSIDFYENQLEEYNTQISAFITKAVEYQEKAHDDSMDDDDDDDDTKKKNKLAFVTALPSRIVHGVLGKDDINTRSGAFITFNNLKSSMAARQMVHYKIPFIMSTVPAPAVKDVYWSNVGISHYRQQLGVLLSIVLTICLCIFWTIPVAFVASISEVDNLKREFSFINDASNAWPGLDLLLKQISPILLAVLNALLPIFLMVFSKQEGHISSATLDASLFAKLALFFIIQTFFVSAIAGSLFTSLQQLVDNPAGTIRDILATNLPQQANFFIAFVFVEVGLGLGLELIRLVPYIISVIRSLFGPNLTAKERSSTWLGLRPLSVPVTLDQPKLLSDVMLFFMILFVYSILSPIVSLVMLFAFLSMNVIYKHQYAHVYDPSNDTGGQMWTRAMRYILFCLIIAEFTIIAVIGIKEGKIVAPLMAPLFIMTILFWVYLEQQHFTVAQYLPSYTAANIDNIYNEYNDDRITTSSWKGAYMQEALKVPLLQPNTDQSDDDEEEEDDYDDRPVAGLDEVIVDTRKESKLSTPRTEDIP